MLLTDLIDTYCAAWSDESAEQRQALLAQVWADDATYTDPTVDLAGAEALLAHIAAIRTRYPGVRIVRTSEVDCHHGIARFGWRFVLADGSSFPEGLGHRLPRSQPDAHHADHRLLRAAGEVRGAVACRKGLQSASRQVRRQSRARVRHERLQSLPAR